MAVAQQEKKTEPVQSKHHVHTFLYTEPSNIHYKPSANRYIMCICKIFTVPASPLLMPRLEEWSV